MNENYRIGKGNLHIAFPNKTILDTYVMCVGCNNCNYSTANNTLCLYADKKECLLKAMGKQFQEMFDEFCKIEK